jgi:hypothetical protein
MRPSVQLRLFTFLLVFSIAFPASAYEYPLSSEAIREAYFLGARHHDEMSATVFAEYAHPLPKPKSGPYIAWIGIETPYMFVATEEDKSSNDRAPDAVRKFLGKPQLFRVSVEIDFTPTYPNPATASHSRNGVFLVPDFWKDFKIELMQDHEIPSQAVRAGPIYSYYSEDVTGIIGAEIELDYNPEEIQSAPIKVEVITPHGRKVKTSFDLSILK